MSSESADNWYEIEQVGDATVVRFGPVCRHLGDDVTIRKIGEALFDLVVDEGRRRLVLNLANVERLDSLMLGQFVQLHTKALAVGGRVVLCHLSPELYHVFQILQLTAFLRIYATELDALQSF